MPANSDTALGFEVLPKRWVVERSLGWFGPTLVAAGEGLRESQPDRDGIPSPGVHPPDAAKALSNRVNCSDRL
jgi:hypothetical protein